MMGSAIAAGGLVGLGALVAYALLAYRQRVYRTHLRFDPRQDCRVAFAPGSVLVQPLHGGDDGLDMPPMETAATSLLLELHVRASAAGRFADPMVELEGAGIRHTVILERGVNGIRFLNITRLASTGEKGPYRLTMRRRRVTCRTDSARLHVCRERPLKADRVLVLGAHPDDAEIAAFGFYADTSATVVTLTAGGGSDRYSGDGSRTVSLPRGLVARLRAWDSITVPQIGGIPPERAVNLAYTDGCLRAMQADRRRGFTDEGEGAEGFAVLRGLNRSPLVGVARVPSWDMLVDDLAHILRATRPTIIVAPHPWLDPHPDHAFTTHAVCEALRMTSSREGRFYFYASHNRHSALWPLGGAGLGTTVLPMFAGETMECDGFYSHTLSTERQREKYLALEAMHDLRELLPPPPVPARVHFRRIRGEVAGAIHGLGLPPTSFLRRAVRPDEVFFTAPFANGQALSDRLLSSS